jgi:hypothetical protein
MWVTNTRCCKGRSKASTGGLTYAWVTRCVTVSTPGDRCLQYLLQAWHAKSLQEPRVAAS